MTTSSASGVRAASNRIARVAAPLRQELIAEIRSAIASGEFEPGERLVERVLCERFDVSRTVVREALRHLEAEGLITIAPNRGPVVTVLTRDDAAAVYEVRAALEGLAAELFAKRASAADRAALEACYTAIAKSFRSGNLSDWLEAKDRYYEVLFTGARNELIRSTVLGLHARVRFLRGLSLAQEGRKAQTLQEIERITRAAVDGKAKEAARVARLHVESAADVALTALSEPDETQLARVKRRADP